MRALAQHQEPEQALAALLVVGGQPPLREERARLGEQRVHAVGLQEAALHVQHGVIAIRLVEADDHVAGVPGPVEAPAHGITRSAPPGRATVNSILFR